MRGVNQSRDRTHSGRIALCSDTLVSTCAICYKPKLITTASCRFWGLNHISPLGTSSPIDLLVGNLAFCSSSTRLGKKRRTHGHQPGLQHFAFMVESRAAVHAVHAKAQVLGSEVVHPPRLFPQYRPYYYATFWLDPEGFMLEAVCLREEEST